MNEYKNSDISQRAGELKIRLINIKDSPAIQNLSQSDREKLDSLIVELDNISNTNDKSNSANVKILFLQVLKSLNDLLSH